MPWNRNDVEHWVSATIEDGRIPPNPARMLLAAVRSRSTLVALCPVCPDATIFADSSLASTFLDTLQQKIKFDRLEVLIVRSPCSNHDDGQGGFLSLKDRELFEQHAKYFATLTLKATILETGTTSLHLHGVTRQKLLASCEQLCAYRIDIAGGEKWVNIIKGEKPRLGAYEKRVNRPAHARGKDVSAAQDAKYRSSTLLPFGLMTLLRYRQP